MLFRFCCRCGGHTRYHRSGERGETLRAAYSAVRPDLRVALCIADQC